MLDKDRLIQILKQRDEIISGGSNDLLKLSAIEKAKIKKIEDAQIEKYVCNPKRTKYMNERQIKNFVKRCSAYSQSKRETVLREVIRKQIIEQNPQYSEVFNTDAVSSIQEIEDKRRRQQIKSEEWPQMDSDEWENLHENAPGMSEALRNLQERSSEPSEYNKIINKVKSQGLNQKSVNVEISPGKFINLEDKYNVEDSLSEMNLENISQETISYDPSSSLFYDPSRESRIKLIIGVDKIIMKDFPKNMIYTGKHSLLHVQDMIVKYSGDVVLPYIHYTKEFVEEANNQLLGRIPNIINSKINKYHDEITNMKTLLNDNPTLDENLRNKILKTIKKISDEYINPMILQLEMIKPIYENKLGKPMPRVPQTPPKQHMEEELIEV